MGLFPLLYIIERCSCGSYYEKILATGEVKCIDEEIPFEIPKGWEWCRVTDVMKKITDGTHNSPTNTNKGEYMYITAKNIKENGISLANITFVSKNIHDEIYSRCNPEYGDLLYIKDGATTGIVTINNIEEPYSLLSSVALLKPTSKVNTNYLLYFLRTPLNVESVRGSMKGCSITRITLRQIEKWLIPIPPLQEQQRIVTLINELLPYLDKYGTLQNKLNSLNVKINNKLRNSIIQEAIQGKLVPQIAEEGTAQELLEQIQEEKQRLVNEGKLKKSALATSTIFRGDDNKYYEQIGQSIKCIDNEIPFEIPNNWRWTRLSYVSSIYIGNSISEAEKRAKFTEVKGRYYIGTKDVGFDNKIVYNNGISIPLQYEQDFRIAPANSILMCIEGGSAGKKIAVLNQDVCFGNKLCCFSPFVEIGKFMYYYLQSPSFIELFNLNKTGIIGGVSIAKVKEIVIPLPPLVEQQRIVAQIEKLFEQLH